MTNDYAVYDYLRIFPFLASGMLVVLSYWLYRRCPQTLLKSWAIGHAFGAISLGMETASHAAGRPGFLSFACAAADGLCGLYMLDTLLRLKDPVRPRRWLRWAIPAATAVPLTFSLAGGSFIEVVFLPVYFRCAAFMALGVAFIRLPVLGASGPTRLLGLGLAAYGAWTMGYPFLRQGPVQVLSIWFNGVLLLLQGVAMAVHLLEHSSRELEVLIEEGKSHALVLLDKAGRISSWNAGAERLFGLTASETISRDRTLLGSRCPLDPHHATEETGWHPRKDGTRFWGETTLSPICGSDRQLRGFAMLVRDISDRRTLEREKARLAAVVHQSQDAMLITDWNGTVRYANPAFELRSSRASAEVLGKALFSVFDEDTEFDQHDLQKVLESGGGWSGKLRSRRADGTRRIEDLLIWPLQGDGEAPPDFVVVARDVTREHLLQEQLYQAQKMEEIGRIAGGVAHDFGNLLAIIVAYNHLLQTSKPNRQLIETSTAAIRRATDRASTLIRQLLAFGRKEVASPQVLDLDLIVEQTTEMLTRVVGNRIKVCAVRGAQSAYVRMDPGQLEQVITNLVVNARDAMPRGGEVTLSTSNEECFDETSELAPGRYVCLSVKDNGVGIKPADQARVFEPFFTTKPPGMGTGLGLAVVDGIIKEAGGAVRVDSELDKGSTFRVYLPAADPPEGRFDDDEEATADAPEREVVLLASADSAPARAAREVLQSDGYRVLEARTEEEALRLGRKYAGKIDLLIGPAIHASSSALSLSVALRRDQPDMRVLLTAGPEDYAALREGALSGVSVLTCPFEREELAQKLRELLENPGERETAPQVDAAGLGRDRARA